jgi:hypothetical protein
MRRWEFARNLFISEITCGIFTPEFAGRGLGTGTEIASAQRQEAAVFATSSDV